MGEFEQIVVVAAHAPCRLWWALPRRGTKTVGAVAFELSSGREIDRSTVPGGPPRLAARAK
jgi:hypothetical protein